MICIESGRWSENANYTYICNAVYFKREIWSHECPCKCYLINASMCIGLAAPLICGIIIFIFNSIFDLPIYCV